MPDLQDDDQSLHQAVGHAGHSLAGALLADGDSPQDFFELRREFLAGVHLPVLAAQSAADQRDPLAGGHRSQVPRDLLHAADDQAADSARLKLRERLSITGGTCGVHTLCLGQRHHAVNGRLLKRNDGAFTVSSSVSPSAGTASTAPANAP